ncbi:UNVERIFIED_CONTAM: hypothetical protein FKN15_053202 [Acipenser sinensis]
MCLLAPRSLDLFCSWSDEDLATLADHCKVEEFNHGQVILRDSSETKNIVFITKGRCDVLRLVDLSECPSYHRWIKQQEALLGKSLRSSLTGSDVNCACVTGWRLGTN